MPRSDLVVVVPTGAHPAYELTAAGLGDLRRLSRLGCPYAELADHFDVSEDWIREYCERNAAAREARKGGLMEKRIRVREQQDALGDASAQMAIWLGKQYLGQKEVQEVTHQHRHYVVGTLPDAKLAAEDWQKTYAPQEALDAIEHKPAPPASPTAAIEDAEFEELHDELGEGE